MSSQEEEAGRGRAGGWRDCPPPRLNLTAQRQALNAAASPIVRAPPPHPLPPPPAAEGRAGRQAGGGTCCRSPQRPADDLAGLGWGGVERKRLLSPLAPPPGACLGILASAIMPCHSHPTSQPLPPPPSVA